MAHGARRLRENLNLLVPFLLIVAGLGLGLASFSPVESIAYADHFTGTLAPGNATLVLPASLVTYLQVDLETGDCGLRLYLATETEWLLFNGTGTLPSNWVDCLNRTTSASGDVVDLILVNSGTSATPYEVVVQAHLVETPYAWLALPATVIALAGLLLFVPRFVLREALRWREAGSYPRKKK